MAAMPQMEDAGLSAVEQSNFLQPMLQPSTHPSFVPGQSEAASFPLALSGKRLWKTKHNTFSYSSNNEC